MKDISKFLIESSKYFTLNDDERSALSELAGILCGNLGDEDDAKHFDKVITQLSKDEIEQLDLLHDFLDDVNTYKKVNRSNIKDDIPLIQKIYNLLNDNDLLDEQWDLIDALEKICL